MKSLLVWFLLSIQTVALATSPPVVPLPASTQVRSGADTELPERLVVSVPDEWTSHVEFLSETVQALTLGKHRIAIDDQRAPTLLIKKVDQLENRAYTLDVSPEQIRLNASSLKGLAHGTATLVQLIGSAEDGRLPSLQIEDAPGTPYRNFMIDMGRNPHSIELLKETIDLLWYYKVYSVQMH
ncbi:MAG: glycoside hydrolase family 20 zincin-like fold domain-containing protein [Planctomycetota bacterium]